MRNIILGYGMAVLIAISVFCPVCVGQEVIGEPDQDGPFIQYVDDQLASLVATKPANGHWAVSMDFVEPEDREGKKFAVTFHNQPAWNFAFGLQSRLLVSGDRFSQPDKLLVLSDIEGEFALFRKILLTNGVMDEDSKWTYGSGHLVVLGDMIDRGKQVMACLWLIYKLEQEAQAAGGQVHFVLGNHEVMNLNGDFRYVHQKYNDVAAAMGMAYGDFFGIDSEIGRWLRTKPIMIQVGETLFVHGGISRAVASSPYDLAAINALCRPFYDRSMDEQAFQDAGILPFFKGASSPFWYRGYFRGNQEAEMANVDKTLEKFGVTTIAVGHTVVETIGFGFDGKVLAVDVDRHAGNAEVALYASGTWYKVDGNGKQTAIF